MVNREKYELLLRLLLRLMSCYKKLNFNFENKDISVSQIMIYSFGGSQLCSCLFAVVR